MSLGLGVMANGMERQIQVEESHRQLNSERRVEGRDFQKRIKPSRRPVWNLDLG